MSAKEGHEGSQSSESVSSSSSFNDEKGASSALSDDVYEEEKTQKILAACKTRNIGDLQELAMSKGGFLTDANRAQAWPILLGSVDSWGSTDLDGEANPVPGAEDRAEDWRNLPRHRDEDQVKLDVDRSFVYYPNDNTPAELDAKKAELSDLITEVLRRQPHLCYFQGYHDICQVLLLVLPAGPWPGAGPPPPLLGAWSGPRAAAAARLSALRLRDFMLPSLGPAVAQLRLIPDLLAAADPALLGRRLARAEPYFALADALTMFAHNVRRLADIARLFDALLAREPAFALYVFSSIAMLARRASLAPHLHLRPSSSSSSSPPSPFPPSSSSPLPLPSSSSSSATAAAAAASSPATRPGDDDDDDDADAEIDMDMLHFALSKLPQDPALDLDEAVDGAARLLAAHPPASLAAWRRVSRHSALRTARDVAACARRQSLADGRRLFDAQLRELRAADRRADLRRRYDTWPNRVAVLAVLVGVAAALYLRGAGGAGAGSRLGSGSGSGSGFGFGGLWQQQQ